VRFASEVRSLLRLAGPIIISQLGGIGLNVMDTVMVAPLGAGALATVGLATSIHMVLLTLCIGTLLGMSPLVSQAHGAGRGGECRRVWVQGFWLALALSVPMVAISLAGEPLVRALGQQPDLARDVGRFLRALAFGVPPFLVFLACRQYLEGMSLTRPTMVVTFLGLGVNYIANSALIPVLGAVGTGWATTLVRWAMLAAIGVYLLRHSRIGRLRGVSRRPDWPLLRRITGIGVPSAIQIGSEVAFFTACAVMMGWFGALELGTHQITINLAATTFMVALGTGIAGSIQVGQEIGMRSPSGVRHATGATYLLAVGAMACFAVLFLLAPGTLLAFYTRDPAMVELGTLLLGVAALFQVFDGAQVAGISVLRGAADTRIPTLITTVAYWLVGVPAAYLLGFRTELGPLGVWIGIVIALAVAALLLGWRVHRLLVRGAPRFAA
jgi:MATE family multidrug resistance protein